MHVLIGLALVGIINAYAVQDPSAAPPLLSNPNINTETHAISRNPLDPIAIIDPNKEPTKTRAATPCDVNAVASATGDKLATLVRDAPPKCLYGVFSFVGNQAKDACNEADMTTIANAFSSAAASYDAAKPTNAILNYIMFLRACYYAQGLNQAAVGTYSANLLPKVRAGLDAFLKRPNIEAQNEGHYEILRESITLISNAGDHLNYATPLAALLTKLSNAWKFQTDSQTTVVNAIYDNFFRAHYDEAAATAFFCKNTQAAQSLSDFMDKQSGLLNTNGEWILRNTAGELGRFAKYSCISSFVSGLVKKQFAKYTLTSAPKVYISLASKVDYYAAKDCAAYGLCTFKADLEKKILPFTKSCDKTRTDTFKIRAQQISDAEANEVCRRLKDQENYFHNLVKDNWAPVNPDTNALIEVVIFNDVDDYKFYASILFGISTDNGGIYIEGDPSKQGNVARYFCYERPKNGKFDVWNLEHEFTHYLDGRYDMKGDFTAGSTSGHTIWWLEGFAEYAANKNNYQSLVQYCTTKAYTLSTIFNNNYNSGEERVYYYGYQAARFMFERHRADVDKILGFFRAGQYPQYEAFITSIGTKYDQEFSSWCTCIANGKPC
jgi:microbial collagenase